MPGNKPFGDKVRELREAKAASDPKYTLRQFAVAAGISATYLSKVERGEFDPPSPKIIKKMAELLGTDTDAMLALANRIDPALTTIIKDKHEVIPDLLRTVSGMSLEQIQKIVKYAKKTSGGE